MACTFNNRGRLISRIPNERPPSDPVFEEKEIINVEFDEDDVKIYSPEKEIIDVESDDEDASIQLAINLSKKQNIVSKPVPSVSANVPLRQCCIVSSETNATYLSTWEKCDKISRENEHTKIIPILSSSRPDNGGSLINLMNGNVHNFYHTTKKEPITISLTIPRNNSISEFRIFNRLTKPDWNESTCTEVENRIIGLEVSFYGAKGKMFSYIMTDKMDHCFRFFNDLPITSITISSSEKQHINLGEVELFGQ